MTLDEATRALAAAGIDNPRGEARLLLAAALGISREDTLTLREISPEKEIWFREFVERRAVREPLAYITGHREFWSLNFEVGPGVLVPRPDTETLIEEALRLVPDPSAPLRIADLGTGSGAILIAALKEFPNATGMGFESSPDAFEWAAVNARRLMPQRAEIRLADWNTAQGPFDLVFSNPPYVASMEIESLDLDVAGFDSSMQPWTAAPTAWRPTGRWRNSCPACSSLGAMPCWKSALDRRRLWKSCSRTLKFYGSHPTYQTFSAASSCVKPDDFLGKRQGFS